MPPNQGVPSLQGRPQQGAMPVNTMQGLQPLLANNPEGIAAILNAARDGKVSQEQLQQVSAKRVRSDNRFGLLLDSSNARTWRRYVASWRDSHR